MAFGGKVTLVHEPTCARVNQASRSELIMGSNRGLRQESSDEMRSIFYFCCWTVRFRVTYRESWKLVTAVTVDPGCSVSSGRKEGSR